MMVYMFQAALLCQGCGNAVIEDMKVLHPEKVPADAADESSYDSDQFPKGPYDNGGGEADCPQHCDHCHVFLENPLTPDGIVYTADAVRRHEEDGDGNAEVIGEWKDYYGDELRAYNESLWDETKSH